MSIDSDNTINTNKGKLLNSDGKIIELQPEEQLGGKQQGGGKRYKVDEYKNLLDKQGNPIITITGHYLKLDNNENPILTSSMRNNIPIELPLNKYKELETQEIEQLQQRELTQQRISSRNLPQSSQQDSIQFSARSQNQISPSITSSSQNISSYNSDMKKDKSINRKIKHLEEMRKDMLLDLTDFLDVIKITHMKILNSLDNQTNVLVENLNDKGNGGSSVIDKIKPGSATSEAAKSGIVKFVYKRLMGLMRSYQQKFDQHFDLNKRFIIGEKRHMFTEFEKINELIRDIQESGVNSGNSEFNKLTNMLKNTKQENLLKTVDSYKSKTKQSTEQTIDSLKADLMKVQDQQLKEDIQAQIEAYQESIGQKIVY